MAREWLNIFFKLSGWLFKTKEKIVESKSFVRAFPYALIIIFFEFGFAIISLPLYLVVSPKVIQERGFIFPISDRPSKRGDLELVYASRRRISLTTGLGAGVFVVLKVILIAATSL